MSDYAHSTQEDKPIILKPKTREHIIKRTARIFPILIISFALHLFILLVIALIPGEEKQEDEKQHIVDISDWVEDVDDEKAPDVPPVTFDDSKPTTDFMPPEVKPQEDKQQFVEKIIVDDISPPESPDEPALPFIDFTSVSNPSTTLPAILGITSNMAHKAKGLYGQRSGKSKAQAIQQNDGSGTQGAVENALRWLAANQEKDGCWNPVKHEGREHNKNHPAVATACATLPFYGAGYSERKGDYSGVIRNSIDYLNRAVSKQSQKPQFGSNYGAALVLMALSESVIMANNPTSKRNAEHVAKYFIDQYTARPGQGWGYLAAGTDLSVTGWVILALKTAKMAQLPTLDSKEAKQAELGYKKWLSEVTDAQTGMGSYRPGHKPSPNMTYVGMFVKQALSFKDDPFLKVAAENTIKWANSNTTFQENRPKNLYGIYYGTLAAFQAGGDTWSAWNPVMKKSLVLSQRTGDAKELGGSWDPTHDHTGEIGGRVYTTALLALTLEIYYRYSHMN